MDLAAFFKAEFAEHHDVARRSEAALSGAFAELVRACVKSIRGGGNWCEAMMPVLIVDDEAPMRTLLRSWVEREGGASVIEAGTAEEGLELVASESPAVALSDIRLPGEDGL